MKNRLTLFIYLVTITSLTAQLGTSKVFDFVHLPSSPRLTAMGGSLVSVQDADISLAAINPALLSSMSKHEISINHDFHFAGINYGYTAYGYHFDSLGISMHASAQYINYGDFVRADIFGNNNGNFDASETAFTVGAAKKIRERLSVGVNLRALNANYDTYGSFAIAADVGVYYENPEKQYSLGATLRNFGTQLNPFDQIREVVRHDVQIGYSKRLKHLPFRYSIIAHNLQQWNIRYKDPADVVQDLEGNIEEENPWLVGTDNFFRHIIINGEFLLGKRENLRIRLGYNHLRKQELSVLRLNSLSGFSFGFGIAIKQIKIDYGLSIYHLEGGSNHLGIRFNLEDMFLRRV